MSKYAKKAAFTHKKVGSDAEAIQQSLSDSLVYAVGKDAITATDHDWFFTTAYVVRDRMIDRSMPVRFTITIVK